MPKVSRKNTYYATHAAVFCAVALLAGSKRFIQYIPGKVGRRCLLAGMGGAFGIASHFLGDEEERGFTSSIQVTASFALGSTIVASLLAKALKGSVTRTLKGEACFGVAVLVGRCVLHAISSKGRDELQVDDEDEEQGFNDVVPDQAINEHENRTLDSGAEKIDRTEPDNAESDQMTDVALEAIGGVFDVLQNVDILQYAIFHFVQDLQSLVNASEVCKSWAKAVHAEKLKRKVEEFCFGKAAWEKYLGDVGEVPPLPKNIAEILMSPCPFWPGEKVSETHMLVLIPKTVNGKAFTLNYLFELIQKPKAGDRKTKFSYYNPDVKEELGDKSPSDSYWALVTKVVIPGSRKKTFKEQVELLKKLTETLKGVYTEPPILAALTAILTKDVKDGEKLYSCRSYTCTRFQEKIDGKYPVLVGMFGPSGLDVNLSVTSDSFNRLVLSSFNRLVLSGLRGFRKF